jgi:Flp pilus assembly protein TadG
MSRLARLPAADEGATLVEYALVLPAFLGLVLGLMQLGAMAWTQAALNYAVQDAARCAAVRPDLCGAAADVQAYAAARLTGMNVKASAFTVSQLACGQDVRAQVSFDFVNSPFWTARPTLTAEACHP